jgi:hypothetical protein
MDKGELANAWKRWAPHNLDTVGGTAETEGRNEMHKMMVLAKAVEGRVEELARWYDERHLNDLLAVPGFVSAERHTLVPVKQPAGTPQWHFMLIYEIEGDPMTVLRSMGGLMGSEKMPTSDALDSVSTLSLVGISQGRRESSN